MKKYSIGLLAIIIAFSFAGCTQKLDREEEIVSQKNTKIESEVAIKTGYSVVPVAKKSAIPTPSQTMDDLLIGTQFFCYPIAPFEFIIRGNTDTGDVNVNITSFTAELTEKNAFNGVFENNVAYHPFVTTVTIAGYVDQSLANENITIMYSVDEYNGDYAARGTVGSDGYFELVNQHNWYKPVSVWMNSAFMYWAH